jgi:hypothetical protein
MDWYQLARIKGLRWDMIQSRQGPQSQKLHSLKVSRSCRAVAWRDGHWLRFLSPHPHHDFAHC